MDKNRNIDIEREALALVTEEKTTHEDAIVFVTDKVAFNVRNLIRTLKKNYWGIFDNPKDPLTGKTKHWVPLTEVVCDSYSTNIDLDTKDINFRAKHPKAIGMTSIVRTIVKNWLDNQFFGESLDEMERQLAIYGSQVWKTIDLNGKMLRKDVDILNLYFDMTGSESLNAKHRVTERALLSVEEVKGMTGWINIEDVEAKEGLHPTESNLGISTVGKSSTKFVDVYEMWGKIPKKLITGKMDDTEEIEGHIVVSGIDSRNGKVHLIEENKNKDNDGNTIRPYEECHTKRVKGRWLARGPAESVMMLQSWINVITNIRITRSLISQLGIFKIRRNTGVTSEMLSKIATSGAIMVNDMNDIEQFVMKEASESSYKDEDVARGWAQKVTSTFEIVTGEQLPSSTPATNAVLQSRAAKSSFTMIKNNIGFFLQRWLKRQAIPILVKNLKQGDLIQQTGNFDELKKLDTQLVNSLAITKLEELKKKGIIVSQERVQQEMKRAFAQLKAMDDTRILKLMTDIDWTQYAVQVYVTNEEFDKGVMAQNLITALQAVPTLQKPILRQLFDLMGLNVGQIDEAEEAPQAPQAPQAPPQTQLKAPNQSEQQLVTSGNVPNLNG